MSRVIVPRDQIGVPAPGTRKKLALGLHTRLTHYTGSPGYNDPSKDWEYARSVARYGISAGKSFEYNYLIGLGGTIFEQAGEYVGAHCATKVAGAPQANFNPHSVGVLLMVGIGVEPTAAMIESFRWLGWRLVETGALHPDHEVAPHYRYRATQCPGPFLADRPGARWPSPTGEGSQGELIDELTEPWVEPQPIEEDDMAIKYIRHGKYGAVYGCFGNAKTWIDDGDGAAVALARAGVGAPDDVDETTCVSYGPILGPIPTNHDVYGRVLR